jgi:hypothetical protein
MDLQTTSLYVGDTLLDVDFYMDEPEPDIGYTGNVNIEDVRIADTDISVLDMIHALNWEIFQKKVEENV